MLRKKGRSCAWEDRKEGVAPVSVHSLSSSFLPAAQVQVNTCSELLLLWGKVQNRALDTFIILHYYYIIILGNNKRRNFSETCSGLLG